jgi:hypothetical protein
MARVATILEAANDMVVIRCCCSNNNKKREVAVGLCERCSFSRDVVGDRRKAEGRRFGLKVG